MTGKTKGPDADRLEDHGEWEERYRTQPVEQMPWFHPHLDADLDAALTARGIRSGKFLDPGAGPGTQAIALARRGFDVTATDVAAGAVEQARRRAAEAGVRVRFLRDDILNTRLTGGFDYAFDRGCFHVFRPEKRPRYVAVLSRLLKPDRTLSKPGAAPAKPDCTLAKPGGLLFLKTFSSRETSEGGPHRFTPEQIESYFEDRFEILSIEASQFHGQLDRFPLALFCTLRRRADAT